MRRFSMPSERHYRKNMASPICFPISKKKTATNVPVLYPSNIIYTDRITAAAPFPRQKRKPADTPKTKSSFCI